MVTSSFAGVQHSIKRHAWSCRRRAELVRFHRVEFPSKIDSEITSCTDHRRNIGKNLGARTSHHDRVVPTRGGFLRIDTIKLKQRTAKPATKMKYNSRRGRVYGYTSTQHPIITKAELPAVPYFIVYHRQHFGNVITSDRVLHSLYLQRMNERM